MITLQWFLLFRHVQKTILYNVFVSDYLYDEENNRIGLKVKYQSGTWYEDETK